MESGRREALSLSCVRMGINRVMIGIASASESKLRS